jgi:hypothetical protein
MPLGGGCGGNDGDENNPLRDLMTSPLSTNYRLETTSIEGKKGEDSDEKGSLEFDCPVCNGRHKRKPHTLLEFCPDKTDENGKPIPIPKC